MYITSSYIRIIHSTLPLFSLYLYIPNTSILVFNFPFYYYFLWIHFYLFPPPYFLFYYIFYPSLSLSHSLLPSLSSNTYFHLTSFLYFLLFFYINHISITMSSLGKMYIVTSSLGWKHTQLYSKYNTVAVDNTGCIQSRNFAFPKHQSSWLNFSLVFLHFWQRNQPHSIHTTSFLRSPPAERQQKHLKEVCSCPFRWSIMSFLQPTSFTRPSSLGDWFSQGYQRV